MGTTSNILKGLSPSARADLTLATLAGNGVLPDEKLREFYRIAQNATPLMRAARVVPMKAPNTHIPKIVFGGMILGADPGEGIEVPSGSRVAPTTSEVLLSSKVYRGSVKIGYETLEDNVEEEELEATIMTLVAERVGVDMEILGLASDTASGTPVLAQQDGWLKRITSNVTNATAADIKKATMQAALTSVPLRFRQAGKYSFFGEDHACETYRAQVGDRATPAGDRYTLEGDLPPVSGRPLVAVGNMPVAAGSPNTASMIFTDPRNLIVGIWKQVKVRAIDWPREDAVYILIRTRVAFAIEHEPACAKITNVQAGSGA